MDINLQIKNLTAPNSILTLNILHINVQKVFVIMVSSGVHWDSKETYLYKTNIILQSTTLLFNKNKAKKYTIFYDFPFILCFSVNNPEQIPRNSRTWGM